MNNYKSIKGFILIPFIFIFTLTGCQEQANTPTPGPVAEFTQVDFDPAWTISGNKIVYAHSNIDNDLSGIYSINSDGSNSIHVIIDKAVTPDWSLDESQIVFSQFNDLFISKSNGDSIVRLTFEYSNYTPKWSSDNQYIAYSRVNPNNRSDIYIIKPDGSENTLIDSNANFPTWTDGSNSLIYFKPIFENNSQNGDSLVQYFFNTGQITTIAVLAGDEYKFNSYPNMTDEGIVFCSMNYSGYSYIYKMDLNGENINRLTESQGYSPVYCSMNQKVAYTNRNKGNGRLWIMNKDGSNKSQLTY